MLHQLHETGQAVLENILVSLAGILDHLDECVETLFLDELQGEGVISAEGGELLEALRLLLGTAIQQDLHGIAGRLRGRVLQPQYGPVLDLIAVLLGNVLLVVGLAELEGVVLVVADGPTVAYVLDFA